MTTAQVTTLPVKDRRESPIVTAQQSMVCVLARIEQRLARNQPLSEAEQRAYLGLVRAALRDAKQADITA